MTLSLGACASVYTALLPACICEQWERLVRRSGVRLGNTPFAKFNIKLLSPRLALYVSIKQP